MFTVSGLYWTQALLPIVLITKWKDAMCVEEMRNERVNSLSTLFQLTPIKHKQLDRGVICEKNQWLLGLRLGSRKKLKDRWLHICRSWIVKYYGDRSHDWGLSQDRCKSTSWSMVHPRIVEIYYYHRIEDQSSIVEVFSQKFRSRKLHKTS